MRMCLSALLAASFCVLTNGCARSDSREPAPLDATQSAPVAPQVPSAEQILQSMSRCYGDMQSAQVDVVETMSLDRTDSRDVASDRMTAALARPNRVLLAGADAGVLFHADGQHLWTVLDDRYSREPCPGSMALIADDPLRRSLLGLGSQFLLKLFGEDAREALTRDVDSMVVLDDELLDGQLTRRLQFTQPEFDWEMWVAVDQPRLIQQIVIDMSKQFGSGLSAGEDTRITTTIRFQNWQIDPKLAEAAFVFRPAEDAQRVEHVMGVGR